MTYNHGAMVPGSKPRMNRKTKAKQKKNETKEIVSVADEVTPVELDPEVVKIPEEKPESEPEFKRSYVEFSGVDVPSLIKEEEELDLKFRGRNESVCMLDESLDAVEADDVITEEELEAEVAPVEKKTKKKRGRKKKATEAS